jgi:hypothetical protein
MRVLVGVSLALVALLASGPQEAQAQSCDAVRFQVEQECPCAEATKKGAYVKCVKKLFSKKGVLSGNSCKKEIIGIAKNSICGRPTAEICCKVRGNKPGRVVKNASRCKKGGVTCDIQSSAAPSSADGAFFNSVTDVCTDAGACVTTTTTTTTTSSSTSTTSTTLCTAVNTCDTNGTYIDFTTVAGTGACGTGEGTSKTIDLACGGLNIGGGKSSVLEGPTPDGATNRFLVDCDGNDCTVCPTPTAGAGFDCTDEGCFFGTPLPIENGGTSTCVVNVFAAGACGNIDLATGSTENLSVNLASNTFLTGTPGSLYTAPDTVCPVCASGGNAVNGTPAAPAAGNCNGGANAGDPCTSTNSDGLTKDCPPGGADMANTCEPGQSCADGSLSLGALAVDLTPLTTGVAQKTAPDGLFCPGQLAGDTGQAGCFGRLTDANTTPFTDCHTITENGSPAGAPLVDGVPAPATLATVFCIPAAEGDIGGIVNLSANLPGPGATSLPGTLTFQDPSVP